MQKCHMEASLKLFLVVILTEVFSPQSPPKKGYFIQIRL